MVKFLIEHGAVLSIRNSIGRTPLHIAAWYGRVEPLKVLLAAGANPNVADVDGQTPLHLVLLPDNSGLGPELPQREAVVKLLLDAKVDAHARNRDGKTPLMLARSLNEKSLIDLLESQSSAVQKPR